jgi:ribosomal protein S12 methylthiotransferase accessory factor
MGPRSSRSLADAIGVTRIARLTGLDRTGIEVASAIRPSGHILQVSNGKGRDWASAARGALHEAAELWAAEQPLNDVLESSAGDPGPRTRWLRARRLDRPGELQVPESSVLCRPVGLGPVDAQWTSNAMGAHASLKPALLHALYEAWEREALARVLPRGWHPRDFRGRRLTADTRALERQGFAVAVFDLTPQRGVAPVAGALLRDLEHGPIPLTAGYASRPTLEAAAEAALLEAAQSRQTEIHAAREDVVVPRSLDIAQLWRELDRAGRSHRRAPRGPTTASAMARAFRRPVGWVELAPGRLPVRVVKVIVPGFRVSELLQ